MINFKLQFWYCFNVQDIILSHVGDRVISGLDKYHQRYDICYTCICCVLRFFLAGSLWEKHGRLCRTKTYALFFRIFYVLYIFCIKHEFHPVLPAYWLCILSPTLHIDMLKQGGQLQNTNSESIHDEPWKLGHVDRLKKRNLFFRKLNYFKWPSGDRFRFRKFLFGALDYHRATWDAKQKYTLRLIGQIFG